MATPTKAELKILREATNQSELFETANKFLNLKNRVTNPDGTFDKAKRFYLDCNYDCCAGIRTPSRAFPFSEMVHGRTLIHVAHEAGLEDSLTELRRIANLITKYELTLESCKALIAEADQAVKPKAKKVAANQPDFAMQA